MKEIDNTGERILLEKETPLMISRHFCAYEFAKDYVGGGILLDIGCGEGYGSAFLADSAKEVLGLDYNSAVIDYARNKYRKDNLKFTCLDVGKLDSFDRKFDVICSFQNIEHIADTDRLLFNINNLLKDSGVFICSTCNRNDASPNSIKPNNKFHVREYLANEFKELLSGQFNIVKIFGLNRGAALKFNIRLKKIGLFNLLPPRIDPVKKFYAKANSKYFYWSDKGLDNCLDFIVVCEKKKGYAIK